MALMSTPKSTSENQIIHTPGKLDKALRKLKLFLSQDYDISDNRDIDTSSNFCPAYQKLPPMFKNELYIVKDSVSSELPWCPVILVSPDQMRGILYEAAPCFSCLLIFDSKNFVVSQSTALFKEIANLIKSWDLASSISSLDKRRSSSTLQNAQHMIQIDNDIKTVVSGSKTLAEFLSGIGESAIFAIHNVRDELYCIKNNNITMSQVDVCSPLSCGSGWVVGQKLDEIENYFIIQPEVSKVSGETNMCSVINSVTGDLKKIPNV